MSEITTLSSLQPFCPQERTEQFALPRVLEVDSCISIDAARLALAQRFRAAGIESPELDARILVGHALCRDHAALATSVADVLTAEEKIKIARFGHRRLRREPVARIIGSKEFWSLNLVIDPTTFVPRPETETVVEAALAAVDGDGPRARALRIADLGTGSGALLLALLTELPNAFGIATDTSLGALVVARQNARRLGLTRGAFVACNMTAALNGSFDLIVANPPYIATAAIPALAHEVSNFDPPAALDGGPDGLDCYRSIASSAPALLKPGGSLVVELGDGQAQAVATLFSAAGLAPSRPRPDLNGMARALPAKMQSQRA